MSRCRKDYRDLTVEERDRFVAALHDVKARGVVDQFADTHEIHFHHAHHSSIFLPWHREFLRLFELELRSYDDRIAIPYWDWRTDQSTSSALWASGFMGGFNSAWGLGRALGGATLPSVELVEDTLALTPYGSFWSPLEGPVHSPPHNWVGGQMMTAASPHDPIFYLHHCMIDLLWARWQQLHPSEERYQASGPDWELGDAMMPWTTTPADVLDHRPINTYRYPSGFAADPPLLTPETSSISFDGIPEGVTSYRAATFDVQACGTVALQADPPVVLSGPPGTAFSLVSSMVPVNPDADPKGRIWVSFRGTQAGDMATGHVKVHGPEPGQEWTIPITARTVARPTAVAAMLLDQSNSMNEQAGIGSLTRADVLRFSSPPFIDVLEDGNAAAIASFDHDAHAGIGVTPVAGGGRALLNAQLAGYAPNPNGWTSIGEAVAFGHDLLAPEVGNYDVRAMVVLTDGHQNHGPYTRRSIEDVRGMIDERVYAIGLGTAEVLEPVALEALCKGTRGYLLMTGELGTGAYFRLAKYYQQILAGVTNNQIVLDPEGQLVAEQQDEIPFWINDADVTATAILLTPAPWAIEMSLEAPNGEILDAGVAASEPGLELGQGQQVAYWRTALPLPRPDGSVHAGRWKALLRISDKYKGRAMATHLDPRSSFGQAVPYCLIVQAFSGLQMRLVLSQTGFEPGATVNVRATLDESGLPVRGATVRAEVEHPDGTTGLLSLAPAEPGAYAASFQAAMDGVYGVHVRADGHSARGRPFSREEIRTAAVWAGGNRPPPPAGHANDDQLCRLLSCLLRQEGFWAQLEKTGIDPRALRRCLEEACPEQEG